MQNPDVSMDASLPNNQNQEDLENTSDQPPMAETQNAMEIDEVNMSQDTSPYSRPNFGT
jgi:hypothetical protein